MWYRFNISQSIMDKKTQDQLQEARSLFYSWKLPEAYRILRRYFDRLPFDPQEGHAENFAMFIRVLLELGKDEELKFYVKELERVLDGKIAPAYRYAMAVVYSFQGGSKWELTRKLAEGIVSDATAKEYHAKAKLVLANYYELKGDTAAIRFLINSIESVETVEMEHLLLHWKAYTARLEKNFALCHQLLDQLLATVNMESDWYAYFCGLLTRTTAFIEEGRMKEARSAASVLRSSFEGRNYRVVQRQISEIMRSLEERDNLGVISLRKVDDDITVEYSGIRIPLKDDTSVKRLFLLLLRKRSVDKKAIVNTLYGRDYQGKKDDSVIYYQVHVLRKWLKQKGIPEDSVRNVGDGYRLVPKVEMKEETVS